MFSSNKKLPWQPIVWWPRQFVVQRCLTKNLDELFKSSLIFFSEAIQLRAVDVKDA